MKKQFLALCMVAILTGCASTPNQPIVGEVDDLYNNAMTAMEDGQYLTAINTFTELERQHPYSSWATKAKMMMAYAQLQAQQYDDAVATTEQFMRYHPGHKDLPYMYYLRGLAYYMQISEVTRDQGNTQKALDSFQELVRRFPDSKYARDARLKITLCRDHLAGQEMAVGRFYQEQGKHAAAINRFQKVVDDYQRTAQVPEALYRLTESYVIIGVPEEAKRAAAILGHNYPASEWYERAYNLLKGEDLVLTSQETWADTFVEGLEEIF